MYIEQVNSPQDIKQFSAEQLRQLAGEVRNALLTKLSAHGGHVGPNLGMVEATIALHYVFNSPTDKMVYDVSHQSYTHKMLTGRKGAFLNPEDYDVVSGYTNPRESGHDFFTIGHTSTSVSLACGLAKARDLKGGHENIIAVIGDGSLSGGEAYEGLSNAGEMGTNLIIVVNDNEMSIAENHGGLYQNLKELRDTEGRSSCNFFRSLGLDYLYVGEGNDIPSLKQRLSVYASAQHTGRDSYYGGGQDVNAYGATTDFTWVTGSQYIYSFDKCFFMPADFTGGLEYNQDNLTDDMWGYNRYTKQEVRIASAFFQNEWKNKQWSFLLGGRLDKHNMVDHVIFSPRANLRYNPTENMNLRASYSFGFRAPQAFDEDLHIENVGGTVSMIELAKDLTEEKSQSLSISGDLYHRWGDFQGNLLIEGFYTSLSDVFALRQKGERDGIIINERYNEKGAKVYGLTLEGKIAYRSLLQLQAGVTMQKAEYKQARAWSDDETVPMEKKMFRTPNTYGYFTLSYNPFVPMTIALSGTYTGSMMVEHKAGFIDKDIAVNTPDFFELNLKAGYDFNLYKGITMQVNAGVHNIFNAYQSDFDRGAKRDSGYIYGPGMPRSYFAGVKLSF